MMSNPSLPPIPEPNWPMQELSELTRAAVTLLGASHVWLALADRKGAIAPLIAAAAAERGAPAPGDPQSLRKFTDALISVVYQRGSPEPLILPDIQRAPDLLRTIGPGETAPRALATVALMIDGKVVGALIATSDHSGGFSDVVRQPLNMLAGMVITVIRLTADLNRNAAQATEMSALLHATRALTDSLEASQVFQAIIASIKSVISCDRALIYHFEERGKQLRVVASIGEGPEALEGSTIALNDPSSKAAWVARERHNYIGVVRPEDETGAHTDALRRPGATFSLLCVPLITKQRLRGVAALARRPGFSKQEVGMMERLGAIAAAALENADLFNQSQAAHQQQQALLAAASDGFAMVDEAFRFTQVNPAFASYLSAHPENLLGQVCCAAFSLPTNDAPVSVASCRLCQGEPDCMIRQVMESRATRDHIERIFPAQGPTPVSEPTLGARIARSSGPQAMGRVIDFSLTATTGADQGPRVLLAGRDVTGMREVQRFRAEQIQLISHEMGAPLHTITTNIEFFLRYSDHHFTAEQIEVLDTARATAMSMRTLVDDLDLISRRDAGELRISRKPTDIAQEAHEAVSEMSILARQKGITLQAQLEPYAPPAMADPMRVRQVARNLISNAIKFTPRGGRIRVSVTSDSDWVTLQVEDTGMGIPESDIEQIWTRYFRSEHTANTGAPGRGLGLAIVRIIMDAHHGTYRARSALGRGTLFTMTFPRAGQG